MAGLRFAFGRFAAAQILPQGAREALLALLLLLLAGFLRGCGAFVLIGHRGGSVTHRAGFGNMLADVWYDFMIYAAG